MVEDVTLLLFAILYKLLCFEDSFWERIIAKVVKIEYLVSLHSVLLVHNNEVEWLWIEVQSLNLFHC